MSKNLLWREARWWERLSSLDLAIEYYLGGKNPANGLSHCLDYMESDENMRVIHIVRYVTRSSTKNERIRNTAKDVQVPKTTEVTSEPNQVLESQPTTDKTHKVLFKVHNMMIETLP